MLRLLLLCKLFHPLLSWGRCGCTNGLMSNYAHFVTLYCKIFLLRRASSQNYNFHTNSILIFSWLEWISVCKYVCVLMGGRASCVLACLCVERCMCCRNRRKVQSEVMLSWFAIYLSVLRGNEMLGPLLSSHARGDGT